MKRSLKLFGLGCSISFLGALPLGTLNLTVANYAIRYHWYGAAEFSAAAITVEMALIRVALTAIRWLQGLTRVFRVFHILSCSVLLMLASNSLLAAWQMETFRSAVPFAQVSPWASGLVLSLTNPLHLPFWMGWATILRSKRVLDDQPQQYSVFIGAAGLGTAGAFLIYALAGGYLIRLSASSQVLMNWVVGMVLLATAVLQIYKTFFRRTAVARV